MLEPSVKHRLIERYQQLNAKGELLSRGQLDAYYSTFRSRFGPDQLANLDGQALLETMHAHGAVVIVGEVVFAGPDELEGPVHAACDLERLVSGGLGLDQSTTALLSSSLPTHPSCRNCCVHIWESERRYADLRR